MAQTTGGPISLQVLQTAGIDAESAAAYAEIFENESLTIASISMLDRQSLNDIGIKKLGHQLAIFKIGQNHEANAIPKSEVSAPIKLSPAKAPQLTAEMTTQMFRKFRVDWEVFLAITNLPADQHHAQLYSNAEESVQIAIINTYPDFFLINNAQLLDKVEAIVTQRSNPMVHRVQFASLTQSDTESIAKFVDRLRTASKDCDFSCPNCKSDISNTYIRDQLIIGIQNSVLQTDMLAKAETLQDVEKAISHALAFESAVRDQSKLVDKAEVAASRVSSYKSQRNTPQKQQFNRNNYRKQQPNPRCTGCGGFHNRPYQREEVCPAWGKRCNTCGMMNHVSKACKRGKQPYINEVDTEENLEGINANMSALIAHISFNKNGKLLETFEQDIVEINADVAPFSPIPDPRNKNNIPQYFKVFSLKVFPDSGASICLAGLKHLTLLGLNEHNLISCNKTVSTVGNFKMNCIGWLPIEFGIGGRKTKQALYICENIQKIYFSKKACVDVGLLPDFFPKKSIFTNQLPQTNQTSILAVNQPENPKTPTITKLPVKSPHLPTRPAKLPYPATPENIPKLKEWLLQGFKETAFSKVGTDGLFPHLAGPPAHVHLKSSAIPKACHCPIPVPFHLKTAVKKALDDDVARGIITPVPLGTPTEWCSTMVVQSKKDGRPRRTIDYQYLNDYCMRETHPQQSPFNLAMQVPPKSFKTILDAVDGYHSVMLDEESQALTTFITEWGRYRYTRMPQGFIAAGDAYTSRYDAIIDGVLRKVKIVDDVLLHDSSIEQAFYHTFDYLTLVYQKGVVLNINKFVFCEIDVEFAGLSLTSKGVAPSKSMLSAIADFPVPSSLTDARSWFGLINQVAWAYSLGPVMQPFRELIRSKSDFYWDDNVNRVFEESKKVIVDLVKEGVATFDVKRPTCLAPDWSKQGMGFLLLQKYCSCSLSKAPVCCPEGWRLVFAGSRFCTDAESRYAPIEGEASAIAWALNKCRMYTIGCPNLLIVTDHAPLLGIFGNRDLSKITNPRLFKLKEKILPFRFSIQHCPGKWHRGSDAMSRNVASYKAILEVCALCATEEDYETCFDIESCYQAACAEAFSGFSDEEGVIALDDVRTAGKSDPAYVKLINQIHGGFPSNRRSLDPLIRDFWEVRQRLSTDKGIVLNDHRVVIPTSLKQRVLKALHSAHQGVGGMRSRASGTVYWPGIDTAISKFRENCSTCIKIAPSQPKEPIILTESPDWPFQKVVLDLFYVENHTYLAIADRFTGWLILYNLPEGGGGATNLINILRSVFQTYGVPEELSRDGGPLCNLNNFPSFWKRGG